MAGKFGDVRALLSRFRKHFLGSKGSVDNSVPLEDLVPPMLKRTLISPHWHSYHTLVYLVGEVRDRKLSMRAVEQVLEVFEKGVEAELSMISGQLRAWGEKNQVPRILHLLGVACVRILDMFKLWKGAMRENDEDKMNAVLGEFKKLIEQHEQLRETLVSQSEAKGWSLLERFAGPFSPVLSILAWGIIMYVSGLYKEQSFQLLLNRTEKEFDQLSKEFKSKFGFSRFWQEACDEVKISLNLLQTTFFSSMNGVTRTVDPLILRGTLGMLAHGLSKLNACVTHYGDNRAVPERPIFSADMKTLIGKNFRQILTLDPTFYPTLGGVSSN